MGDTKRWTLGQYENTILAIGNPRPILLMKSDDDDDGQATNIEVKTAGGPDCLLAAFKARLFG